MAELATDSRIGVDIGGGFALGASFSLTSNMRGRFVRVAVAIVGLDTSEPNTITLEARWLEDIPVPVADHQKEIVVDAARFMGSVVFELHVPEGAYWINSSANVISLQIHVQSTNASSSSVDIESQLLAGDHADILAINSQPRDEIRDAVVNSDWAESIASTIGGVSPEKQSRIALAFMAGKRTTEENGDTRKVTFLGPDESPEFALNYNAFGEVTAVDLDPS